MHSKIDIYCNQEVHGFMTNGNASIHHLYLLYTALGCGSTPTTEGAVVLPALTIPPEITQQANQSSQ
jgi:hypothetical protein